MNIQLYIFGKASLECLGQQGGSKNHSGHSPGLNSWHLEDISESLLDNAEGRSIGERVSTLKQETENLLINPGLPPAPYPTRKGFLLF